MNTKRYLEFDRLNVLYCLIVVFIHVFGIYTARLDAGSVQQTVFAAFMKNLAFVVQGFMFLSAAKYSLIYKDKKIKYKKFLVGRLKKVVLPYILCVCIYYVVYWHIGFIQNLSAVELIRYIFDGTLSAQFYFVIAIVQFYILLPLWIWLSKKIPGYILVISSFIIYGLWLYNFAGICVFFDRVFLTYLPFWAIGLAAGRHYAKFRNKIKAYKGTVVAIFVLMCVANAFLKNLILIGPIGLEAFHTLYAVCAVGATYAIFVSNDTTSSLIVGGINDLSFHIYLWHCLILPFIDMQIIKMSFSMMWQEALFRAVVMYGIIFAVAIMYGVINKRRKK